MAFAYKPVVAQSFDLKSAAEVTSQPRIVVDLTIRRTDCSDASLEPTISNEIVVCAPASDPDRFRLRSRVEAQSDYAARTMDAGEPRAPNLAPPPCVPTWLTWCPKFGSAVSEVEAIDVTELPEAPAGSDADRISRGLAPQNY